MSLSLPRPVEEAVTARAEADGVGRGRVVCMAYRRHRGEAADVRVGDERRVLTKAYLHDPEIAALDELAAALGESRSQVVAALLTAALL